MSNHLQPLGGSYSKEIAALLDAYPRQDGYLLSLFRTFANSTRFLKKGVGNFLDKDSPLPLRIREIIILRATANYRCEYEWGIHTAIFAKYAKLDERQIEAIVAEDAASGGWTGAELRLINAVDQFCAKGRLDNEAQAGFEHDWSLEQQLEIIAIIGAYHTVSMVANTAALPLETFADDFPSCIAAKGSV